MFLHQKVY